MIAGFGGIVVPAQWLSNSSAVSGRLGAIAAGAYGLVSQPAWARRLRHVLILLALAWGVLALGRLIWALVPAAEPVLDVAPVTLNPVSAHGAVNAAAPVDIDQLVSWHLFGQPGASVTAEPVAQAAPGPRSGIEEGAAQTRLNLLLRGIVASTEDGLGHAIIEANGAQLVYAVGDKLPVQGNVSLAKVMPRQVVLDNGGTYELLVLFEELPLGAAVPAPPSEPAAKRERRADQETTSLAQSYRTRLFENPQSLADVVTVSAVREGGNLLGYRVSPGRDVAQFAQLGFEPGDLVVAVNGVTLDDPANTMILYNDMRSASEAVFELRRNDAPLTLSVNLDSGAVE